MSLTRRARLLTPALVFSLLPAYGFVAVDLPAAGGSPATDPATKSDNIQHVANVSFAEFEGERSSGTDLEFATLVVDHDGEAETAAVERTFVFAGSYQKGLQIIDVTDPAEPVRAAIYDCAISQGDVQVFQRDGGTFVTYTHDNGYGAGTDSACYLDAERLGHFDGATTAGTFIADVSDPYDPTTVAFVPLPKGSHNQTVHPSGRYLYNSNSELINNAQNAGIEIIDITHLDAPVVLDTLELPVRPGLGTDSHDLTFSQDGTRAYSAALSQTVIIDTEAPAAPEVITSFVDPAINVEHQANPITLTDPRYGTKDFLIVEDEFAGAAGAEQSCPSGGVHVYDITDEKLPVKVGYWNIDDFTTTKVVGAGSGNRCTAHVFELHEDEALMTIAFYALGVSVVDLSSLVGIAFGATGVGMQEVAYAEFDDSDTWAVKAPSVDRNGTFHIYGNDQIRGLDVYEVTLALDPVTDPAALSVGTGRDAWLSPLEADRLLIGRELPADYEPYCLLGDAR
ncbi:MAG: hypothetical protein KY461_09490 [Actinobacteria bacterium]|nr:hypothetical protein [Actinomycetota bacterium]